MSLNFKYIPLTFLKDLNQIKEQVKNTIILSHFFDKNKNDIKLEKLIEGTQYGYNASALQSGENKFLRISDITDGVVNWKTVPFCDCADEETYLLKKDDLLIARTGGTTGKSFLIDNPPSKAIYAGYLIRIRANKSNVPQFLNLFLNSYAYWSQVLSLNKGEFRPSVNATKLKQLILPKCSIQEQKDAIRISKGETLKGYGELTKRIKKNLLDFDKCQDVLGEIQTQKTLLTQLKQAILQEAIQGQLTADWRKQNPNTEPASELLKRIKAAKQQLIADKKIKKEKPLPPISKEDIPFELPEGWGWTKLRNICSKTGSGSTPRGGKSAYLDSGIPFIRSQNVYDDGIILKGVAFISDTTHEKMKSTKVQAEDLLLNITGGSIGRCCIVPKEFEIGNINQHVAIIRAVNVFSGYFIHKVICSLYFQNMIFEVQTGAGREGLPKNKMDNILIAFPPLEEQKEIVKKVEILLQHCQALEQEIKTSEANTQMLMQAVLKEAFE